MRESTSPPRTPTPRSPSDQHNNNNNNNSATINNNTSSSNSTGVINSNNNGSSSTTTTTITAVNSNSVLSNGPHSPLERSAMNDSESHAKQNSTGPGGGGGGGGGGGSGNGKNSPNIVHFPEGDEVVQQQQQQQHQPRGGGGKSQLDLDFPKLTPPKTSFNPNATGNNGHHPHLQKANSVKNNSNNNHSSSNGSGAASPCVTSCNGKINGASNGGGSGEVDKSASLPVSATTMISTGSNGNGGGSYKQQTTAAATGSRRNSGASSGTPNGMDQPDGHHRTVGSTQQASATGRGMSVSQNPPNQNLLAVVGSATARGVDTDENDDDGEGGRRGAGGRASSSLASPSSVNGSNYCDNESGRPSLHPHHAHREVNFSDSCNDESVRGSPAGAPESTRGDANNQINIQFSQETETRYIQCDSPTESLMRSGGNGASNANGPTGSSTTPTGGGGSGGSGGKKRGGASGKGANKAARLKNMSGGSSSSVDGGGGVASAGGGGSGSGGGGGGGGGGGAGGGGGNGGGVGAFMSRDNSCDQFTDQSGVNLLQFFKETLNKNFKDRNMLMKIEKELLSLAMDRSRSQMKFPPMSSYNRMLIHRVAAYFGMEHNVDATQQCVIAEVTSATRIPDIRFKNLISDSFSEEPRKSILKRDTHSFDEYHRFVGGGGGAGGGTGGGGAGNGGGGGLLHCPDRGMLDRKAKSFEEREEEYGQSKRRLFKNREHDSESDQWQWISTDGGVPGGGAGGCGAGGGAGTALLDLNAARHQQKLQNNRLLKVQSVSIEGRSDERPCVSKSHSFGGYGGSSQNASLLRGDSITSTKSAGARLFSKQDSNASTNTPWRLSPSSSGYKTQSIRSDSVTPSPTGYGSGDHTPEPGVTSPSTSTCGVMWAVTDMASVPKGSVLIDPQTFQPIVNQDGSLYHFDPSNLPPTAGGGPWPSSGKLSKRKFEKQKSFSSKNNLHSSSSLESSIDLPAAGKTVDCGQQTAVPGVPGDVNSGTIATVMTMTTATTTTPTTIAEEVVGELGCYDSNPGGLNLLSTKDNPDMDENSSLCEEISQTTNELGALKLQKHQATSPMLQASELQPIDMNEIQFGANPNDNVNLLNTANTLLLNDDRSMIDETVDLAGDTCDVEELDSVDKQLMAPVEHQETTPPGAAIQLLHVHEPVSSNSTLEAAEEEDDEDRSETPTDGGQEEANKKHDIVKVANVVQTVVPLTSYTSATTTPNSGGMGMGAAGGTSVNAYTVTYDGGGSGHPGATVYATGAPGLSTTTYQTAPDGAIYAVPSPLVYTYPTTMDPGDMSGGYFVPVYDPQQQQRDASLCSTPGASIYSAASAGATSTVLHPIAYTQGAAAAAAAAAAAYSGAPLYQNPVMYSSDQFPAAQAAAAAAAGQLSQYPISYPIGIGYPFNGATYQNYWNQPITYYVPQTPVPSTVGGASILMPPPISQTPTHGGIITTTAATTTPGTNSSGGPMSGKRNTTPPSAHGISQSQGQAGGTHSASVTPVPISPFATNIPVPLPDPSSATAGAPMYAAFPQPLYPNMLPFASPMTAHAHPHAGATATSGGGTVVNSILPTAASFHPHPASSAQQQQQQQHQHHANPHHHPSGGQDSTGLSGGHNSHHQPHHQAHHHGNVPGGGTVHYSNTNGPTNNGGSSSSSSSSNGSNSGNHSNNSATNAPTPQSTPSTPLSLPMSLPSHHGGGGGSSSGPKSMPLFPTPPMMPSGGYVPAGGHHHYGPGLSEERKNGAGNGGGYQGKNPRLPGGNSNGGAGGSYFNYNATAGGRQMTPNGSSNTGGSYQPGMKGGNYPSNNSNTGNSQHNGPLILGPPPPGKNNRHEGGPVVSGVAPNGGSSSNKPPLIPTLPNMAPTGTPNAGDKTRLNRPSKPPNLDLKRSYSNSSYSVVNNNRNTPSTNSNESNGSPNSITSSSVHESAHPGAAGHPLPPPHHAPTHHHGGHGGNHPSTPTSHHHGGPHALVTAGGQPTQHGSHHHHPSTHHHHPHGGGNGGAGGQQQLAPGQQQQPQHHHGGHGGGGGGAGTTHYFHPATQQLGPSGPHAGQPTYYAGGGSSQRGGSVGSNNGSGTPGGGGGGNAGGHTNHPHAMPAATAAAVMHNSAVAAAAAAAAAVEPFHQQLIPINAATGMSYVKIGQAYFPSLALPQSRRSPPNEIRPIAGVYPTMNMVMPASRQFTPRPQHNSGYNSNKSTKALR